MRPLTFRRLAGPPPAAALYAKPRPPVQLRGLGDDTTDPATVPIDPGFGAAPVSIGAVLPWLLVGGFVVYGIAAMRNRPPRRRKQSAPPIVVGRGMGMLAIVGLVGLSAVATYGVVKATSGGQS